MLYPQSNLARETHSLNGLWAFKQIVDPEQSSASPTKAMNNPDGFMAVPASYNELCTKAELRDHVGVVVYEREFYIPKGWRGRRIVVRVGSASHHATLAINGSKAVSHKGGFLPFEAEITELLEFDRINRITLHIDNRLDFECLPPGRIHHFDDPFHPKGLEVQDYFHDYYNFGGIHRNVTLYCTEPEYIEDITVKTDGEGETGQVHYTVQAKSEQAITVELQNADGITVASGEGPSGTLTVGQAQRWEPGHPYLYTLVVRLAEADEYRQKVGIRTIRVTDTAFLINEKPFYFKGFGMHEDADIFGKGHSDVILLKNFQLLQWIGANSFRTSHYPYSEEWLQLADEMGIVVIDEAPSCGLNIDWNLEERDTDLNFTEDRLKNDALLEHHKETVREMIARDKNHPSVVLWSLGNESSTNEPSCAEHYRQVFEYARTLDDSRPFTNVERPCEAKISRVGQFCDVICVNLYPSWYGDPGRLDVVKIQMLKYLTGWHERFQKPVICTEYGTDTLAGYHRLPAAMFTEEYQCQFLQEASAAFDAMSFFVGEHIWNFADFMTKQGITRVDGNKKGIFTRQRQPKMAAHQIRERWLKRPDFSITKA